MEFMVFGKLVGGLLGLAAGGVPGLVVGALVGHLFDRALARAMQAGDPANVERIRQSFFETTFLLLGHIAKADGRISRSEIDHTEQIMAQMGLDGALRRRAIDLFRRGAEPGFDLEAAVGDFRETCGPQPQLYRMLLLFLISLAHADQKMEPPEHAALVSIASLVGIGAARLEELLRMARAQEQFRQGFSGGFQQGARQDSGAARQSGDALDSAYTALGVDSGVSDRDLKRAYRKLMSEHHPDKLIAKGVPEDMIKLATERCQEIQAAYDVIKRSRGRA
jgi:DnaJ like chaperone protein